jgi:hypothetical protein
MEGSRLPVPGRCKQRPSGLQAEIRSEPFLAAGKVQRSSARTIEKNSKPKTQNFLPPRRETPLRNLALFFGEEFIPDFSVVRLVAVVLQLRHLATHIK